MVATGVTTTVLLPGPGHALYKSTGTLTSFADRIAQEWRTQDGGKVYAFLQSDLECLIKGTIKCTKPKPRSTKETKTEAFRRYMKIIYRIPHSVKVDFDGDSDEITFEPELFVNTPNFNPVEKVQAVITPVKAKKKKRKKNAALASEELGEESGLVLPPPPTPPPPRPVVHKKPAIVKKEIILPKIPSPPPPPPPNPAPTQKPLALPPREPSPEPPAFLQEFLKREWFKKLYPDKKNIPSSLCPDSFFLQLTDYLGTCNTQYKPEILSVLETLHRRKLLQNVDQLYQRLLDTVPKMVAPNMGASEQSELFQLLNFLICLKSVNEEIVKTLLTLIAYKELGLREKIMRMLKSLGVDDAEEWLQPELESWESALRNKCNMWRSLYVFADSWHKLWTTKYKDHIRDMFLRSTERWKPPSFTAVDVLTYFCSMQKEEYLKAKQATPRANNTVLLPRDCFAGAIHRLGETHTMSRNRKPSNLILPPLRNRPFLLDFPNYLSLPLPRVKLSPFCTDAENHLTFLDHRYYILEKSHVEYYR